MSPISIVQHLPSRGTPTVELLRGQLREIIAERRLTALFQPIVHMGHGTILGYEGLIRGPSDSPLHSPIQLLQAADACGQTVTVEHLCRRVVIEEFVRLGLEGQLFLNVSAEALVQRDSRRGETLHYLRELGLASERVVIELTENKSTFDYELLRQAITHYRDMGFRIAIDDLGEGFSSLRRWSELRPEFVKIDMHFIQGIDRDPVKHQFVQSIFEIARRAGTQVIAEGIETAGELLALRKLGIPLGQGYFFARPSRVPEPTLRAEAARALTEPTPVYAARAFRSAVAASLASAVPVVEHTTPGEVIYRLFADSPSLNALPVLDRGVPVGLITRSALLYRMTQPYSRELDARKPCRLFMDPHPLVVEHDTTLLELSRRISDADQDHLANGFLVIRQGYYLGYGTGLALMRAIMQIQVDTARFASPLTGLPGNLHIDDCIEEWLDRGEVFRLCHCDIDHFKPFNDRHGYARGDEIIRLLADQLQAACDPQRDFVGHVGGDDFVVLFRSRRWEATCEALVQEFAARAAAFFDEETRRNGGYYGEDREGRRVFVPLLSLSLGVVEVRGTGAEDRYRLSEAAAAAKSKAKKAGGNRVFTAGSRVQDRGTR